MTGDGGFLMSSEELETASMREGVPFVVLVWVDNAYGLITTAPYMHDGRFATLEEVVDLYDCGGIQNPHLSKLIIPLGLTAQEKNDLVEYMKAMNGEGRPMTAPTEFPQ